MNNLLGSVNLGEFGLGKSLQNEVVNVWKVFKLRTVLQVSLGGLSLINLQN